MCVRNPVPLTEPSTHVPWESRRARKLPSRIILPSQNAFYLKSSDKTSNFQCHYHIFQFEIRPAVTYLWFFEDCEEIWCYFRKMADDEAWQYWRSMMGYSDDDGKDDFEGFTLQEIVKGDESDIDLDIVVQNQVLIRQFSLEISSSSDLNRSGSGGEELLEANDADLPGVASKAKRWQRQSKNKRDALTTWWSAQTLRVQPEKAFQGFAEDGNIKVGIDHTLPVDATPFDYFCLLLPETFCTDVAHQTNVYAEQRQQNMWKCNCLFSFSLCLGSTECQKQPCTDPLLQISAIADVMSKGRFQKLSHYFHLNENSAAVPKGQPEYDPLLKVPSQWKFCCCPQRATWIWPFAQSAPSAWCHHCQQLRPLLSWQGYFPWWGDDQVEWSSQLQAVHKRYGKSEDFVEKLALTGVGGGGGDKCPSGQMWLLLLLFYCSPHLYVNNKTAESTCIYKLMLFYVQIGLDNTYKIYFSMTWAALTQLQVHVTVSVEHFISQIFISRWLLLFFTGKQNPWGIKVWCAADPRSGYMLEFDIYLGRVLALMPDAAWVGASCYYEDGRQVSRKRASPVLWQLLLRQVSGKRASPVLWQLLLRQISGKRASPVLWQLLLRQVSGKRASPVLWQLLLRQISGKRASPVLWQLLLRQISGKRASPVLWQLLLRQISGKRASPVLWQLLLRQVSGKRASPVLWQLLLRQISGKRASPVLWQLLLRQISGKRASPVLWQLLLRQVSGKRASPVLWQLLLRQVSRKRASPVLWQLLLRQISGKRASPVLWQLLLRQVSGKRASPVLWQLLLFSQAWARSGRDRDLHEDEGWRHPFSSRWQHGCYPLEGQATSGYSFHKCSARDGGKQKWRHQGARRRWQYPNQFWHTTTAWGASTWLTSTTLTTLLDSCLCGGGDTFVGGCCRRPWSSLSSSGAKATSLLQPARYVDFCLDELRQLCKGNSVRHHDGPQAVSGHILEWPPPSLCHTQLNSFPVPKRTAVCV